MFRTSLGLTFLFGAMPLLAGDAPFDARGKLLFSEDFSGSTLPQGWAGKPGKWEMTGDAVKVSEVADDKHAAVRRHPLQYHDAIFEFWFEMDGARTVALSINNKSGHVCRLIVTPRGSTLQVDKPNATSEQKAVKLATSTTPVEPGKWHKAVVEVHGARMFAQIDDGAAIVGENPRIDVDKTDLGLPVAGVSAKLKDVKVYALK
ncbi:MAG TPA: hypothetical protein VGL72_22620 [Bryobacteraceae bacterium]|jgi:hypothetical protein